MSELFTFDDVWAADANAAFSHVSEATPTLQTSAATTEEAPKKKRAVKGLASSEPTRTPKKKDKPAKKPGSGKVRRARRMPMAKALEKEMEKLRAENATTDEIASLDATTITREIRDAAESSTALLERLNQILEIGDDATEQLNKYAQLLSLLEKHKSESVVVQRVCDVFQRLLRSTTLARNSCSRLPNQFAQMLIRVEAFMRATTSALVPQGIAVLQQQSTDGERAALTASAPAEGQLALVGGERPTALVRYGAPQSRSTFRLEVADVSRAEVSELQNTYLSTSMMHANFDPRITVSSTNGARRDAQRRAAQLKAGNEIAPELFGAKQLALMQAGARTLALEAAPMLAIEAGGVK